MQSKTLFQKLSSALPKFGAFSLLACAALSAHAGDYSKSMKEVIPPPVEPKFFFSLGGGAEFDIHATKFVSNGQGFYIDPALRADPLLLLTDQSLLLSAAYTKVHSLSFSASHAPVVTSRAELGYNINPALSAFIGFTYGHANGYYHKVGQVSPLLGLIGLEPAVLDLNAKFGDYESYAGRAGFKLAIPPAYVSFLRLPPVFKPYFTYSAGGKYVEPSTVNLYAGGVGISEDVKLYNGSWVFTTDAQLGVEYLMSQNTSLCLEGGIGYDLRLSRPGDTTPDAFTLGNGVNSGGSRLYCPVTLAAKYRF